MTSTLCWIRVCHVVPRWVGGWVGFGRGGGREMDETAVVVLAALHHPGECVDGWVVEGWGGWGRVGWGMDGCWPSTQMHARIEQGQLCIKLLDGQQGRADEAVARQAIAQSHGGRARPPAVPRFQNRTAPHTHPAGTDPLACAFCYCRTRFNHSLQRRLCCPLLMTNRHPGPGRRRAEQAPHELHAHPAQGHQGWGGGGGRKGRKGVCRGVCRGGEEDQGGQGHLHMMILILMAMGCFGEWWRGPLMKLVWPPASWQLCKGSPGGLRWGRGCT